MRIVDFGMIWKSAVVEVIFDDGIRAACDLWDIVRTDPFKPEPADDGRALRWPDGTVLSAERLRDLCLDQPPAVKPTTTATSRGSFTTAPRCPRRAARAATV
jgi:hypothetical protein